MVREVGADALVPRSDVSFRLDQKTSNFKVTMLGRELQWSEAPKLRLRFLPIPKCRVRLQRGWQEQPAHNNERRSALDAAAAMRTDRPEN